VLEKIEADLLSGALGPGDRLPPERELAATLGVGRSSVREALRVLEVMGLIRTATGSGPTAGAIVTATPHGGLAQLLRLQVAARAFPSPTSTRRGSCWRSGRSPTWPISTSPISPKPGATSPPWRTSS
jgi:DNA-binding transcriptional MocR family regulator